VPQTVCALPTPRQTSTVCRAQDEKGNFHTMISSWLERSTVSSEPGKWGKGPRLSEGLLLFPTWVNGTTTQGTVGDHTGYPVGDRTGQPVGEGVAARAAIAHRTRTACNLKDGRWVDLN
jgi:hypothetical protein